MEVRTQFIRGGQWCTLEKFWNTKTQLTFVNPTDSEIRTKYGLGWLSKSCQLQTLDGNADKVLTINKWLLGVAKVQIRTRAEGFITYTIGFSES